MVVHCGNILIDNSCNHSILLGENVSEEFGQFLILHIMFIINICFIIPYIHNTLTFNVILDKRCIKFLWTLFNSGYDIYRTIIKYSLHNRNTTLGENVRYFMHKYNIVFTDWFEISIYSITR